jgi:hypothetical protein
VEKEKNKYMEPKIVVEKCSRIDWSPFEISTLPFCVRSCTCVCVCELISWSDYFSFLLK